VFLLLDGDAVPLLLAAAAILGEFIGSRVAAAVCLLLLAEGLVGTWAMD